jgi:hypothetical protein
MERQVSRARGAFERPQVAQGARGALDFAAGVTMPIPIIGDVLGFSSDVARMRAEPEERTPLNMGLAALGLIPFVPPAVSYGLGRFAKSRGVEIAPPPSGPAASQAGAFAYHGSPHTFYRFDSRKMGTGEGAQAYGLGTYLAEAPGVAKGYRDKLNDPIINRVQADLYEIAGEPQWAIKAFDDTGKVIPKVSGYLAPDEIAKYYGDEVAELVLGSKYGGDFKNLAIQEGSFYKVDLPDPMIARMLDWDKPLNQQSPEIQASFAELSRAGVANPMELTGGEAYKRMREAAIQKGKKEPAAAKEMQMVQKLRQAGIPGVRYLDGDSRAAGAGTSNFVVFPGEEQNLRILERNDEPLRSRE